MAILTTFTYIFVCDWPAGCSTGMNIHGAQSQEEAKGRARRDGWTISKPYRGPSRGTTHVRCPRHAYRSVEKPKGRPRRIHPIEQRLAS